MTLETCVYVLAIVVTLYGCWVVFGVFYTAQQIKRQIREQDHEEGGPR